MRYEEYKDSGVEWIGEVPKHWEVKKMKYTANLYNGDSLNDSQKKEYFDCSETNSVPYIASKDIDRDTEVVDYDNGMRIPNNGNGFSIASNNTTLLCIEGGSAGKKIAFINQPVCFVNKLCCFDSKLNNKFNYYFICSNSFKEPFFQNLQGMIGGVKIGQLKNFMITIPPLNEQQAIASYLDEKCGKINGAIDVQQKKIDLLNELKQTIITNAVTKGLNPNAPMKDSGVEWIGKIPEHWEVRRLKYNSKFINGYAFKSDTFSDDGEYPVIRIGDICNDGISYENIVYVAKETELDNYRVLDNDILIAMSGATVGKVGLCNSNDVGYINQRVGIIRSEIHRLIWYNLLSPKFLEYIYLMSDGSAQPNISSKGIGDYYVAIPPYNEQKEIIEYLSEEVFKIDSQISKANRRIELLNELKQSIITEVVTGKIKVC